MFLTSYLDVMCRGTNLTFFRSQILSLWTFYCYLFLEWSAWNNCNADLLILFSTWRLTTAFCQLCFFCFMFILMKKNCTVRLFKSNNLRMYMNHLNSRDATNSNYIIKVIFFQRYSWKLFIFIVVISETTLQILLSQTSLCHQA